jgi:hypothetical protein
MTRAVWAAVGAAILAMGCDAVAVPRGGEPDANDPSHNPLVTGGSQGGSCPHTTDQFSFSLSSYSDSTVQGPAHLLACGAETGSVSFPAVVTGADGTSLTLSACPDGGGACHTLQVIVAAQDLSIPLPVGAFVRIDAAVHSTGDGCAQTLMVQNLPSFGGVPNPITAAPILWLAGAEGTLEPLPGASFQVADVQDPGCASRPGYGDDALTFTLDATGDAAPVELTLPMGASYIVQLGQGGAEAMLVRNLRSFRSATAPPYDMRNFAYWITYVTPELP